MTDRFFCKTTSGKWEEVTPYVYANRKHALNDDGTVARYSDVSIAVNNGTVQFNGTITVEEIGRVCRFLSVTIPQGQFAAEQRCYEPATIKFLKGKSVTLHVLATGENYKKAA
jgi:hypothetical protein